MKKMNSFLIFLKMPLTLIHLKLPHWTKQIRINSGEIQIGNEVGRGGRVGGDP